MINDLLPYVVLSHQVYATEIRGQMSLHGRYNVVPRKRNVFYPQLGLRFAPYAMSRFWGGGCCI